MKSLREKNLRKILFLAKQVLLGVLDAVLIVIVLSIGGLFFVYAKTQAPDLKNRPIDQTTVIYDRTGEHILYEIHGEENRKIISHEEIPDAVRIATIAAEDDNFYHHIGIDFFSILRALKVNLENKEILQGGSTITQQLARNAYLTREKSLVRKIKETLIALKIERKYTKDEILDFYLNEVPYGANAYGIETAAETFFGKSAKDLTLDEAAFLAALPKAPSYLSPYEKNKDKLVARQKNILNRIAELELAQKSEVKNALVIDILAKIKPIFHPIEAPHFVFYVREQLEEKYGKEFVEKAGLQVKTTLDYEMQKQAEDLVRESVAFNEKRYGASNSALVALNPKNGEILTMVGSRDYFDPQIDGQVNVTLQPRQPGSSFKPIVYSTAFENGYQPESQLIDAQTNFGKDGSGRDYIPRNYSGDFKGLVSMRQALSMSLNIPAIKTMYLVGLDNVLTMAKRLGITTLTGENYGLSLAIGGGEITPLEGASAFSTFANDGKRNPPTAFHEIKDAKGKFYDDFKKSEEVVMDPQIARKINSILSDNASRTPVFGPNSALTIAGHTVAAKTGTTQWFRDAWTIGYTPNLAVAVWSGNNDGRPMRDGADGSFVSAPIWNKFMAANFSRYPDQQFADYDRSSSTKLANVPEKNYTVKTIYFDKKKGKEISESKMKKTNPKNVEIRTEIIAGGNANKNDVSMLVDPIVYNRSVIKKP